MEQITTAKPTWGIGEPEAPGDSDAKSGRQVGEQSRAPTPKYAL